MQKSHPGEDQREEHARKIKYQCTKTITEKQGKDARMAGGSRNGVEGHIMRLVRYARATSFETRGQDNAHRSFVHSGLNVMGSR